jgi:serine/threonine-protein kinase
VEVASRDDRSDFDERKTSPLKPGKDDQETQAAVEETAEQVKVHLPAATEAEQRYRRGDLLGEGGMGLVWLTEDRRIGRRVAMKVLQPQLTSERSYTDRFVREALVQGQLEHPSIVPVYDLGVDAEGRAFFTMKRVRGVTLDRIVEESKEHPETITGRYSQRRLLSAFSRACLAVDFANRRGVLHRDLKPANIMLGDYGEVYVLDWGIAKLLSDPSVPETERVTLDGPDRPSGPTEGVTAPMVGTAGYMSPEQISGAPEAADPASDVYALGAILFELLTLKLLHEGSDADAVKSTLLGVDARPSVRAPERDVAPELEQICVRATAHDPRERLPSAREIHEAIERYLDGERNAELRKELARRHARDAAAAISAAHDKGGIPLETRRAAMNEIGRALALDPGNEQAVSSLVDLLTEPPREIPDEVRAELADSQSREMKAIGWIAGTAYLSMALYLPFLLWAGVRSVPAVVVFFGLAAISMVLSFSAALKKRPGVNIAFAASCTSTLAFGATTTLFGSLVVMPALVAANATGYAIFLRGWRRVFAALFACAVIGVAVWLEVIGVPWSMYSFGEAGMTIKPGAIDLLAVPTITILAIAAFATLLTPTLAVSRIRDNLTRAEQQLSMQAWQIRQLAPAAAAAVPMAGPSPDGPHSSSRATGAHRRSGRRVR